MEVRAKAKYIRMSPKKIRLVVDVIRGMKVEEAQSQLKFINKAASRPVAKLLDSVLANALHNFQLKKDNLYIKKITVDEGTTLKRWRPRAFGRAAPIKKRSAHITIVVDEIIPTKEKALKIVSPKPKEMKEIKAPPREIKPERQGVVRDRQLRPGEEHRAEPFDKYRIAKRKEPTAFKQETKKAKGFLRKIFQRKSV